MTKYFQGFFKYANVPVARCVLTHVKLWREKTEAK